MRGSGSREVTCRGRVIEREPRTGLPKVAEGQFWRITPWHYPSIYEYRIQLCWDVPRKFLWWKWNSVAVAKYHWALFDDDRPDSAYEAAVRALMDGDREQKRESRKDLGGDYR